MGHRDVVSQLREREVVVAHEFGHALGLKHSHEPNNLMMPATEAAARCSPDLDDRQLSQIRPKSLLQSRENVENIERIASWVKQWRTSRQRILP